MEWGNVRHQMAVSGPQRVFDGQISRHKPGYRDPEGPCVPTEIQGGFRWPDAPTESRLRNVDTQCFCLFCFDPRAARSLKLVCTDRWSMPLCRIGHNMNSEQHKFQGNRLWRMRPPWALRLTHQPAIVCGNLNVGVSCRTLATKPASKRCHHSRSCAASWQSTSTAIDASTTAMRHDARPSSACSTDVQNLGVVVSTKGHKCRGKRHCFFFRRRSAAQARTGLPMPHLKRRPSPD